MNLHEQQKARYASVASAEIEVLKEDNQKLREALERIRYMDWSYQVGSASEKAWYLIEKITSEVLNK